ncbi:MAG: hypothetical protein GF313_00945 [Caldithrix sp.]|nr:hypothetical protein [Caldithrix sp.]
MTKRVIQSDKVPAPIGPYSQAIEANGFVFTSGQIALDAATGQLIEGGVEEQTRKVLDNVKAILDAGGIGLNDVVKTTIYLKNISDFSTVNQIYAEYFGESMPARSTVEVSRLPKDVFIEIDCMALKKE